MRLLIAGGGTGGHIYPALAVARSLRDRPTAPDLVWLGGHRGLEADLVRDAGIRVRRLALRSLRTVDFSVHAVVDPLRLALSVPQAAAILAAERPAAILTTGGYVAVPTILAAGPLRIPVVLWEGNAIPGRAVRATARLAQALAVSYEAAGVALAGAHRPMFFTGTPIRDVTLINRADARARLGLPADAATILIFGGSQAVRRFNAAVTAALPRLVERVHVLHVSGETGYAAALAQREQLPADRRDRYRPYPFLRDDMLAALVAADLVVGRAGSSTLAEVTALGIPAVIVPYPHASGHQAANARILAAAGAARIVADEAFDADALVSASEILFDEPARTAMATAARRLGRPGAADAIAALVLALAERRPLPDAAAIEAIARGTAEQRAAG
jgi:UDP-N-acetylglucosamine--N-acetylmuramyl-(pentapeptide) pyrophosphoryl-undecaprenol N-acetylglucosamine transferase